MENDFQLSQQDKIQGMLWTMAIFLLPGVPDLARMVFVSDKEAHFFFFFWAAIISTNHERNYPKIALLLVGLGLGIEIVQDWMPGRSLDIEDLIVDCIGVGIGFMFRLAFDLRFQAKFKPFNWI